VSLFLPTVGFNITDSHRNQFPYYGVPSVIAVNMILAGASGGIVAIIIATWAQVSAKNCHSVTVYMIII
jgi:hypothetical protein